MSAISRCARYARTLHNLSHKIQISVCNKYIVPEKGSFAATSDRKLKRCSCLGLNIQTRWYSPPAGEKSEKLTETSDEHERRAAAKQQNPNQPERKWYSDDYPASMYWKKMDYTRLYTVYNFRDYCKAVYSALFGSGVTLQEFHGFMSLVERKDSFTDEELTLILKSLGFSNREMGREEKQRWTHYLLARFKNLGIHLDASHYNIVLRNYLECSIPFSPVEFLSAMEKEGVAPNGVTLARCIMAYCNIGDIKSASQVLEHMRACDLPINQRVYTSLIKGNFLAGNKETAMKLFHDTKEMGFDVDQTVYHAVICGHAMMGDLEGVKQMFAEAKENYLALSDSAICSLIEQTAPKGRKDIFDYLMEELKETSTYYYTESVETMQALFELEQYENGYEFFKGLYDPSASLFYKAAIMAQMPVEEVLKYSNKMNGEVRDAGLLTYYDLSVRKYAFDQAAAILPHMEAEELAFRPHLLWPLIMYYKAMENKEGLVKVVPFVPADVRTVSYFLPFAFISLGVSVEEYKKIIQKHSVLPDSQKNALVLHYCLSTEGVGPALELAKQCDKIIDICGDGPYFLVEKAVFVMKPSNWLQVMELMEKVENSWLNSVGDLLQVAMKRGVDKSLIKKFMLDKGVCVLEGSLKPDLKQMFTDEELKKVTRKRPEESDLKDMTLEELENLTDRFLRNSFSYKIQVLQKSFNAQRWSVFGRVLAETDVSALQVPSLLYRIAQYHLKQTEDIPAALQILDRIKVEHPTFEIHPWLALNVLRALFNKGEYEDGLKFLAKHTFEGMATDKMLFFNLKFLFDLEPTQENLQLANNLLSALKKSGLLKFISAVKCFKTYWQFVSQFDDMDTVLSSFDMLRTEYNFEPDEMTTVLGNFIKNKDKTSLQTVFDKVTEHVSERIMLLSLAAAFLENGQKEKARKVLATPGLRINSSFLSSIYSGWMENGKVQLIEEFGHMVEHLPGTVDKAEVIFMQLKAMCLQSKPDIDACVKFFETKFEEEGVYPNIQHLKYFSTFLKNHGRKAPLKHLGLDMLDEDSGKVNLGARTVVKTAPAQPEKVKVKVETKTENVKTDPAQPEKVNEKTEKSAAVASESEKNVKKPAVDSSGLQWGQAKKLLETRDVIRLRTMTEIVKKYPEQLLTYVQENELSVFKKAGVLAAVVKLGNSDLSRRFKQALFSEEGQCVRRVARVFHGQTASEPFLQLYDIVDSEEGKAAAASFCVNNFAMNKDFAKLDEFVAQTKAAGLSFEKIALVNENGRDIFVKRVQKLEELYKEQSRDIPWDISTSWKIPAKSEDVKTASGLPAEKPPSDIGHPEKVDVTVAVETPKDVTVAVEEKTKIVATDSKAEMVKGSEGIIDGADVIRTDSADEIVVDTAKTVSTSNKEELRDKAEVISDSSDSPKS